LSKIQNNTADKQQTNQLLAKSNGYLHRISEKEKERSNSRNRTEVNYKEENKTENKKKTSSLMAKKLINK